MARLTRRDMLQLSAMAGLGASLPFPLVAQTPGQTITASTGEMQLVPGNYPKTGFWGYGGRLPGQEIRLKQGEVADLRFVNALPDASTIHWHGMRIDNAMDGVPELTQDNVQPEQSFEYKFTAGDAGTYWYHAHNRSFEQVARGLYGALIVEEAEAPDVDRDEVLVLDDWLLNPDTAQVDTDFEAMHSRSHGGRLGNFVTTNASYDLTLEAGQNQRLRLRIINAANARIFELALAGLEGWAVAYDGMPLEAPEAVTGTIALGPGQRVDLIVDVVAPAGERANLVRLEREGGVSQVAFNVGPAVALGRRPAPAPLPPNPAMVVEGLDNARRLRLRMEGGAMGNLRTASFSGQELDFRGLVDKNQYWAFNGLVGMTDTPLAEISRGETVRLEITNDTAFPHAMHLHGMHFREVMQAGGLGPLRDTVLMTSGETREIAFMADNPGKWLFHCHMLSHAASGMMTWVDIT